MTSTGTGDRLPLTRERILDAALEIVDALGVDGLTMRRLGASLGVEAMSIYNHVPNKSALLDAVVERVLAEIRIPTGEATWTERLRQMTLSYRQVARAHPRVVPLLASRPFNSLPALDQVEAVFEILAQAGFTPPDALNALRTMSAFAVGFTLWEAAGMTSEETDRPPIRIDNPDAVAEDFPRLMEMAPLLMKDDPDEQFEFGVGVLLAGMEERLSSQRDEGPSKGPS